MTKEKKQKNAKQKNLVRIQGKTLKKLVNSSIGGGRPVKLDCYPNAVLKPFSDEAIGCYVQDGFRMPTRKDTMHQSWSLALSTPGVSSGGTTMLLMPSPVCTLYENGNTLVTGPPSPYNLSSVGTANGMISVSSITGTGISAIRTVSFGMKLKNLMNFATVAGKVIIAPVILSRAFIPDGLINSTAMGNTTFGQIGDLYLNGAGTTNVANYPGAQEIAMDQLVNSEVELIFPPVGPLAKTWKPTNATGKNDIGLDIVQVYNTAVTISTGLPDGAAVGSQINDTADCVGYLVQFLGIPTALGVPFCDLEVIAHFESQVNPGAGLVPAVRPPEPQRRTWEEYLMQLGQFPTIRVAARRAAGVMARIASDYGSSVFMGSRRRPLLIRNEL